MEGLDPYDRIAENNPIYTGPGNLLETLNTADLEIAEGREYVEERIDAIIALHSIQSEKDIQFLAARVKGITPLASIVLAYDLLAQKAIETFPRLPEGGLTLEELDLLRHLLYKYVARTRSSTIQQEENWADGILAALVEVEQKQAEKERKLKKLLKPDHEKRKVAIGTVQPFEASQSILTLIAANASWRFTIRFADGSRHSGEGWSEDVAEHVAFFTAAAALSHLDSAYLPASLFHIDQLRPTFEVQTHEPRVTVGSIEVIGARPLWGGVSLADDIGIRDWQSPKAEDSEEVGAEEDGFNTELEIKSTPEERGSIRMIELGARMLLPQVQNDDGVESHTEENLSFDELWDEFVNEPEDEPIGPVNGGMAIDAEERRRLIEEDIEFEKEMEPVLMAVLEGRTVVVNGLAEEEDTNDSEELNERARPMDGGDSPVVEMGNGDENLDEEVKDIDKAPDVEDMAKGFEEMRMGIAEGSGLKASTDISDTEGKNEGDDGPVVEMIARDIETTVKESMDIPNGHELKVTTNSDETEEMNEVADETILDDIAMDEEELDDEPKEVDDEDSVEAMTTDFDEFAEEPKDAVDAEADVDPDDMDEEPVVSSDGAGADLRTTSDFANHFSHNDDAISGLAATLEVPIAPVSGTRRTREPSTESQMSASMAPPPRKKGFFGRAFEAAGHMLGGFTG